MILKIPRSSFKFSNIYSFRIIMLFFLCFSDKSRCWRHELAELYITSEICQFLLRKIWNYLKFAKLYHTNETIDNHKSKPIDLKNLLWKSVYARRKNLPHFSQCLFAQEFTRKWWKWSVVTSIPTRCTEKIPEEL